MMSFEQLVIKDLTPEGLTDDEFDFLSGDLGLWRDTVGAELRRVEAEQTEKKADALKFSPHSPQRKQYENWKTLSVQYKNVVVDKLQDVKSMIAGLPGLEPKTEKASLGNRTQIAADIYAAYLTSPHMVSLDKDEFLEMACADARLIIEKMG